MIHLPRGRALLACVVCFACASARAAQPPRLSVREYLHTSWTESAGQPLPAILGITQTPDGYLWLGGNGANLRFDGLRFSEWPLDPGAHLPDGVTKRVSAGADGSMWIVAKGVARVRGGSVRTYSVPVPLSATCGALFPGPDGRIWILLNTTRTILFSLDPESGAFRELNAAEGLPSGRWWTLTPADGAFWLGGEGAVCRWIPGSPAKCHQVPGIVQSMTAARSQVFAATATAVYSASRDGVQTVLDPLPNGSIVPKGLLLDGAGKLWVGTTHGLFVVDHGVVETYTREDGLSGEYINSLAEDAEGDVWVATLNGLDRFRRPRVLHIARADGLPGEVVGSVLTARDGSVWLTSTGHELSRIVNGKIVRYSPADGLPPMPTLTLHEDAHGRVWVGSGRYVTYFENGRFVAPVDDMPRGIINELASDSGGVWAAAGRLWHIAGSVVRVVDAGLPPDILRVLPARDGVLWLSSYGSGVFTMSGGDRPVVTSIRGLGGSGGAPRDLLQDSSGNIWVAFGPTLIRIRRGRITTWTAAEGLDIGEIAGLAADTSGNLWITGGRGVTRVAFADLGRSADEKPVPASFFYIRSQDGFRVTNLPGVGHPRISAAPDGRVWVCERDGVGILDPELLRANPVPPPVVIEDTEIDGVRLRGPLQFRGRQFRITYTGNSLMAPERVRFRYRLDPGDANWTDADTRREVTLVGLPPGNYRFRVAACNLDGVCNERGATLDFRVMPFFYQTIWFRLAVVAALGGIGFGIYRLRLRQIVKRFHLVAQERARVTREIHDSLLQGFAGVVLQLDAASRTFDNNPAASKDRLNRALDQADNSLREARQMLLDMRLPILEDKSISEALNEVGVAATRGTAIAFHVRSRGVEQDLPYTAQAALFLIGREAITNAVNHANPKSITVQVITEEKTVRLIVQDDGSGFDLEAAGRKAGHLGVTGMGERARQVAAELKIDTAPGEGTRLEVIVRRKRT
jgi:ligand-binding sensor domain-containing protein/anti-sigma regulatory factor (Ser/Thr protein kinase)